MLKLVVKDTLENCKAELAFFTKFYQKDLKNLLEKLVHKPFTRVLYREATKYLQEDIANDPSKWQIPDVDFGNDIAIEHKWWLAETKFECCMFVLQSPKALHPA